MGKWVGDVFLLLIPGATSPSLSRCASAEDLPAGTQAAEEGVLGFPSLPTPSAKPDTRASQP